MKNKCRDTFEIAVLSLLFMVTLTAVSPNIQADNEISIEQTGTDLSLDIKQIGADNVIKMLDSNSYFTTTYSNYLFIQINEDPENPNEIIIDEMSGANNDVKICQGCAFDSPQNYTNYDYTYDSWEAGGHSVNLTMYGSNNGLSVHQTNQGNAGSNGHSFELHLAGDDNEVTTIQQHDGSKSIDLTIFNDENDVFIRQKGNGNQHTATIELDGIYGTDLILKQFGTTTQTYTLYQNCITVGGCTVSVTQE